MDVSGGAHGISPYSSLRSHDTDGLVTDHLEMTTACSLCGQMFTSEGDRSGHLQNVSMCGDCKFLLLEDSGNPLHGSSQERLLRRRIRRGRRSTYGSSESVENLFSQQFAQTTNQPRHMDLGHDTQGSYDPNSRSLQSLSSHTTPNGSRRWHRMISDIESDGYSINGESESNVSFGTYGISNNGDSDTLSFSAYGDESDASVDSLSIFDTNLYVQSRERSDWDSDSDIDPMNAGPVEWDSDDHVEVETENQWEHVRAEGRPVGMPEVEIENQWERVRAEGRPVGMPQVELRSDTIGRPGPSIRDRRTGTEFEGIIRWRIREGSILPIANIFTSMEESGDAAYLGDPGDYLDAQGFEEYLQHLVETESTRRGAPPAAASFVSHLPLLVVTEELQKPDGLSCAVCKDFLAVGAEVTQLPCLHLYHPSCILPWLTTRNTCPLCRYELPADDTYFESKHSASHRIVVTRGQQQDGGDDNSSVVTNEIDEAQELGEVLENVVPTTDLSCPHVGRRRWVFLAAAPIVSLMGVVLVLWFGNPLTGARLRTGQQSSHGDTARSFHSDGSIMRSQRLRRWWWF